MLELSVLDLSPIASGSNADTALDTTVRLAQHAEALGYRRFWMSEHHNMAALASAAPEVLIAHVANKTSTIKVGSGGIMLPNHSPLKIAETFRLLEALHPGRIDLGIGRAPGTDTRTALALRESEATLRADDSPERTAQLMAFLDNSYPEEHPYSKIVAVPVVDHQPDVWVLGSSEFSAQLAAQMGLPFAFAHHFGAGAAQSAFARYFGAFEANEFRSSPCALVATSALCAPTEAEARELGRSADLNSMRLRTNRYGPTPSLAECDAHEWTDMERATVEVSPGHRFIGTADDVYASLQALADASGVQEVMITTTTHNPEMRLRSYELLAKAKVNDQQF